MAMYVMHCAAVKLLTVFRRPLAARGEGPVITLAIVEMMIHVSVEMIRTVIPGSRPDEYAA